MKSLNIKFTSASHLREFIEKNIPKNKSVLVQIFSGLVDEMIIKNIIDIIKEIENVKIIGCTTDGEIINGNITIRQIAINFNIFDKTTIKTAILEKENSDFEIGKNLVSSLKENNTKCMIFFSDGLNINAEEFLKGVESETDVLIAGGMAGDNSKFVKTLVFNEEKIVSNGCVGASLNSDELIAHTKYSFDWQGIGKIMTVTKADKNVIYEIDNKKVIDVYKNYFGDKVTKKILNSHLRFPILVNNELISAIVIKKNEDNSLILSRNINEGDKIQFGFGNFDSLLEEKNLEIENIESMFVYACMSKRRLLGEYIAHKIEPFKKLPIIGLFTYGEFYKNNKNYICNQAMSFLFLSEEKNKVVFKNYISLIDENLLILNAISNLVNTTNKELEIKLKQKMTRIRAKNLELEYLYYHDDLTELKNKNALQRDINSKNTLGTLLIDIKRFSSINDVYGEEIGDLILKEFSKELLKVANKFSCNVYRVAADQFMTLNLTENAGLCKEVADEIFNYFKKNTLSVKIGDKIIYIDIAVRIAMVPKTKPEFYKIRADLALNYAKKNKKDFIVYNEDLKLEEKLSKEIKTIEMVRKAIKEDKVIPVFQKIEKKDSVSYECLVRIKDENNKLISPFFFLETIKHTRYYQEITKIMIKKSFEYFKNKEYNFSINFSFDDINNEETVRYLCDMIDKYKMYNRVIIEILECEAIQNFSQLEKFIKIVRSYGAKVAIDDFGSGYSNFIYLTQISPDFIKIDGSLIKNIHIDEKALIITKNIHNFAKEIGCKTIAEFVHNEEVFKIIKALDIYGIQGYYLAEPKEEI
jgi:diguanylate cyclase (GGDEF)-like protein